MNGIFTYLPETNNSHLKMDGWKTTFLLGPGLFQGGTVSFRECIWMTLVLMVDIPVFTYRSYDQCGAKIFCCSSSWKVDHTPGVLSVHVRKAPKKGWLLGCKILGIIIEGPRKRVHFSCIRAVPFLGPLICLKVAPPDSSCLCGGHLGGLVCSAWKLCSRPFIITWRFEGMLLPPYWIQSLCGC